MAQKPSSKKQVIEWTRVVQELVQEIEGWSAEMGWPTSRQHKEVREKALGSYEVDDLVVKTPSGIIVLEVKARDVVNGDGRVDLYALENLNRLLLVRKDGHWRLKTDTGVRWPKPWNKETFIELPEMIATAA
jgi:hypothetical protein